MNHPAQVSGKWREAQRRAEIYLCGLRGQFGVDEQRLVESALTSARVQARLHDGVHPVKLVMEALIGFLPPVDESPVMAPPIQRTIMLPEPIAFPIHEWMARLFGCFTAN